MSQVFFVSHSIENLAEDLFTRLQSQCKNVFARCLIATPHLAMKEWLQFEGCKKAERKAILGWEFSSWDQVVQRLLRDCKIPTRTELAAAIWTAFPKERFLQELTRSFEEYCLYGFPQNVPEEALWQKKIFDEMFQSRGWSTYPEAVEKVHFSDIGSLHLFGIDFLPPAINRLFWKIPDLSVYRFSPCAMFWEDLCSASERRKVIKKWEQKGVSSRSLQSLEKMLRDAHPLLANWGMIGRAMLAGLGDVELQENYEGRGDERSLLELLKLDLLFMEMSKGLALPSSDRSIQCFKTGSSLFREVQWLRCQILQLCAKGVCFSDIRVYAPDISVYAPLVEFCFSDISGSIPFRIDQVDLSHQSCFYQGILHLFKCVKGRWEASHIAALFEMSAFYQKAKWQREEIARFRDWIEMENIRWGLDLAHRREVSDVERISMSANGCWDQGWDSLIDRWLFLCPDREECLGWSEIELFEQMYGVFQELREVLFSWKEPKTLEQWGIAIGSLVEKMLFFDENSEADQLAKGCFDRFLKTLRKTAQSFPIELFPFSLVETFLGAASKEEGGSLLNAVRFSELQLGALLPARFVFLIGMDEESFPKSSLTSSLDLPSKERPWKGDFDRYLFLQAIFSAKEKLLFSYADISKDDGKPVAPSLLIQELFGYLDGAFSIGEMRPSQVLIETAPSLYRPSAIKRPSLLCSSDAISSARDIPKRIFASSFLSIQELTRFFKHPFQVYLKRVLGIELRKESKSIWKEFENPPLERHKQLLAFLEGKTLLEAAPLGLFGEAAERDLAQRGKQFQQSLQKWGIDPSLIRTLHFTETGQTRAPLSIAVDGFGLVHLIGEGLLAVPGGVLHLGGEDIGSVLRRWPELLSVLVATETSQVYFLKTGHIRDVADPLRSLQSTVELYMNCQSDPFFLHPEWADAVLRKNKDPVLGQTKDEVVQWVLKRSPSFDGRLEREGWQEQLQSTFSSLKAMFPTKVQHGEV